MGYLTDTIPTDSEAVKLGANRIRQLKTQLNTLIAKIFTDAGAFLTGWLTTDQIAASAVVTEKIADSAVTLTKLPAGVLAASDDGRSRMADGFITPAKLANDFESPAGSVPTVALQDGLLTADTTGRAKMEDGFVTPAKTSGGIPVMAVGTYAGSNSVSAAVTGLSFQPNVIYLTRGKNRYEMGAAFAAEVTAGAASIHTFWQSGGVGGKFAAAVQFTSNGFIIVSTNFEFNETGTTHTYVAMKI